MLRFGTDGVRGRVGVDLTSVDVESLGFVIAEQWPDSAIVIGDDGRESGAALVAAFARGAAATGAVVTSAGLLPTPALARAAARRGCVAVSITASHNPWHDNGVKVFAPGGRKLTDVEQRNIESRWHATTPAAREVGSAVPTVDYSFAKDYVDAMTSGLSLPAFDGLAVTVDCANGAMSGVAARVMNALGLQAEVRNSTPSGRNINEGCGAVHPENLATECAQRGTIGVAFDGDGDRVIAIDENGNVIDGDRIIALLALDLHDRGRLAHDTVVVTSMTNLGFHRAMRHHGVEVVVTDVGDRAVLAAMEHGGFVLGGEQSGHVINSLHATTGDGLLTALLLLDVVRRAGRPLSTLADAVMQRMPQLLRNVRLARTPDSLDASIGEELRRERAALGEDGRIVVRVSGTEPVVRIMVEASTMEIATAVAERLERAVIARS